MVSQQFGDVFNSHFTVIFLFSLLDTTLFRLDSRDDTVFLPVIDNFFLKPVQAPMAIPRDLADRYVHTIETRMLYCTFLRKVYYNQFTCNSV